MHDDNTADTHYLPASNETLVLEELLGASKQFGTCSATVQAVRGLDLEVHSGELLALLEPTGRQVHGDQDARGSDSADVGDRAPVRA
ncbi:hypothetical protein [Pengzhenrongella sicca]|uniref:Uncharacterized protein n=1 Tax=Pengzhenrongella sicca TaxID=2819238 RepID=A0A8A4ZCD3_9MICO|nr:hypothetical protein [Pengzhenrongella sicca]QTE28533.1 hypothetical protein J4E96_14315 [Pengzhenrongella sicca]